LIKTTSKRLDGAVPSTHDPYAIWEVKEYYDSTTYGSGVTEGTYAAMLVADEIRAIEEEIENTIEIYILVDGYAGWQNGFGDLCRIIDFLHMGYIDAAIFGKEVETEWPKIVSKWD
jgi:methionine salvage enolase-phosphatase E1